MANGKCESLITEVRGMQIVIQCSFKPFVLCTDKCIMGDTKEHQNCKEREEI